jgi:hypothetical protein
MRLPIFKDDSKNLMLLQNVWSSLINPFLNAPALQTVLLKDVSLTAGSNNVNHRLGRKLQGWYFVRKRAAANVHDNQDNNQNPELTLTLVSDASVTVDLVVF